MDIEKNESIHDSDFQKGRTFPKNGTALEKLHNTL